MPNILSRSTESPEQVFDTHPDPWWTDGAHRALIDLAASGRVFTADDLRESPYALPEPHHPSQWGALFATGKKAGLIREVGFTLARSPRRRGGVLRQWVGITGGVIGR